MKRPLRPDELRLWSHVAGTVHPLPGRATPKPPADPPKPPEAAPPTGPSKAKGKGEGPAPPPPRRSAPPPRDDPRDIEPNRRHRIARERDEIGARLDLHGYGQDRARSVLEAFLVRAWDSGLRSVLVITGKGTRGDGVLRRYVPEWLAAPHLREIVAGVSEAHRRHGGEGALYVALKRRPREPSGPVGGRIP